jgi:membrane-anchored protein YejM (alkaline phosphatase superfamily)
VDVWLLRIVPVYFRKKVFSLKNGGYLGVISAKSITENIARKNIQNNLPVNSVQLFNRLIDDEKNRPATGQYVHAHLYFPHMPYIYSAEGKIGEQTNMVEQTFYATKLLEEFLDTLKEQGKYHNAIIIIHSDHGVPINGGVGNLYLSHCTPPIPSITLNQLRALLLIKKAGISGRPLCASQVVSQLADIPMTLGEMTGLDWETEVGKDIFKVHSEAQREIPAYLGYHTEKGDFGQAVFKGTMQHICYDTKSGWGRKSDIEAVWEAD